MKIKLKNVLIIISLALILLVGIFIYSLFSLSENECRNDSVKEYISPDKENKAIYYVRNCGATSDFYTFVDIEDISGTHGSDEKLKTIFSEKGGHENYIVEWKDNGKLIIYYDGSEGDVYTYMIKKWQDIIIEYRKE